MKQHNYWLTTAQMPGESNTITPFPEKVDVAIIGGGYTGLSAAYTLAKQGVNVRPGVSPLPRVPRLRTPHAVSG